MENKQQVTSGGIGLGGILFIVFLVLKLTGYINWSWIWVTCPLWAGLGVVAVVFLAMLLFLGLILLLEGVKRLVSFLFGYGSYK